MSESIYHLGAGVCPVRRVVRGRVAGKSCQPRRIDMGGWRRAVKMTSDCLTRRLVVVRRVQDFPLKCLGLVSFLIGVNPCIFLLKRDSREA